MISLFVVFTTYLSIHISYIISLSLFIEKARLSNTKQKSTKCNNDGCELIDNNNHTQDEVDLSNLEDELNFNSASNSNNYHLNPNSYQPSLIKALYNAFGYDFLRAGLLKLIHDSSLFVGPQVLNRLIQFLRDRDAPLSYGISLMLIGKCEGVIPRCGLIVFDIETLTHNQPHTNNSNY